MKKVRTQSGAQLTLDGDLMAVVETLYREVAVAREFHHTYQDMRREIEQLVDQFSAAEQRRYLIESLFLNTVTYENEMVAAYIKKIQQRTKLPAARPRPPKGGGRSSELSSRTTKR
jgi:hypothetical protein